MPKHASGYLGLLRGWRAANARKARATYLEPTEGAVQGRKVRVCSETSLFKSAQLHRGTEPAATVDKEGESVKLHVAYIRMTNSMHYT